MTERENMKNGYFKLTNCDGGFGLRIFPAVDGGDPVDIRELIAYLEREHLLCDQKELDAAVKSGVEQYIVISGTDCPVVNEDYQLNLEEGGMRAVARFFPPSETGKRLTMDEFLSDLRGRNITMGIQMQVLQDHFMSDGVYCTDLIVAQGKEPRHGTDARIEYYFNTDVHIQPTMNEDGSVDFFHLNVINHCLAGQLLAKIIPADPGEYGWTISGTKIKPREVKRVNLKHGNNINISEDRQSITSAVDGHVVLVDDTVFVSDVYEVENVDNATGNIDFQGSVQVNGNVASNFEINARGNVVVNGVVEGAKIIAGGNIIIACGVNGMGKGVLQAGGNVIAKFIENTTVEAEGYISTEAVLHSVLRAGTEITVSGKKGFITGGRVQADNRITVKTLGAEMGASTIVEVGVNPKVKARFLTLQKEVAELVRDIKAAQPTLVGFAEKRKRGATISPSQMAYIKEIAKSVEEKKQELLKKNTELQELQERFDPDKRAEVVVNGVVYPGTTIVIGDVSTVINSSYKYCKFERRNGDVKMAPL